MASAPTATTEEPTEAAVSLPADVLRDVDRLAAEQGETRSDVFVAAARRYLFGELRGREAHAVFAEAAREAGFRTEDDVEEYLDSLPDPHGR